MKNHTRIFATRSTALALACALLASGPGFAQQQRQRVSREPVTLNFVNADIEAVARTMAAITGRNIVVDPRVKGTITLSTERPVPPQQAYNQFLAALRLSGFTMVDSGGILKLVPEADAKLQSGTVSAGAPRGGGQMVTQIFRLNYAPAGNMVPILRPLISPNNTINVDPSTNSLVITDYSDNLQRIGRIIASLDVSNATDVDVIPLQHSVAADIAPVVQRLIDASGAPGVPTAAGPGPAAAGDASFRTSVVAEARSNSLLVRAANPARLSLVRSLVQRLDQPGNRADTGNIWVVYLKNAEATRLAVILRAAMAATPAVTGQVGGPIGGGIGGVAAAAQANIAASPTAISAAGGNPATAPTTPTAGVQTGGQIQADPATNALIITAPEPQYRQIRAVIDRLDSRRAQVYVEGLVVEVNASKAAEFGIQWQGPLNSTRDGTVGFLGTNFRNGGAPSLVDLAIGAATGNAIAPGSGVNFGTVSRLAGRNILTSIANFLQVNGDGNVLSTPNLLTLDNEEAKIVVGQNVPFVTGQFTNTGTSNGSVNPFQTIERKDVGLTLRIRPQISENGTVKMQIFQEVSSVDEATRNAVSGLTTNKSSIESNVLVEDGAIVVLGGLLKDAYSDSEQKVPVLGDVPVVGNLFRSQARNRTKTNLMVFLRPVVLRDANQSELLSIDRYELMRGRQIEAQPGQSLVTPINHGPVMPPMMGTPMPGPSLNPPPAVPSQPIPAIPAPLGR